MNRTRFSVLILLSALAFPGCMSAPHMGDRHAPAAEYGPMQVAAAKAPAAGRQVVGTSQVQLEVADAQTARTELETAAEALGGYAEKNEPMRVVVRVPMDRMQEAAKAVANIGRVVGGAWQAEDVTEAGDAARARIKALENEVARLNALLAQAKDGQAQAGLNLQLQAAQRELAQLTGAQRQHDTKAAMATLDIRLQLDPALACLNNGIPVAWVRTLTEVLSQSRAVQLDRKPDFDFFSVGVELPAGFIKFHDRDYTVEAVDANSTHLRITRRDNPTQAGSDFWFPLVRRGVAEAARMQVVVEKDVVAAGKHAARLVVAERAVGGQALAYAVATAVNEDHVYTVEMWGRKEQVAALQAKLEACINTLRVK